MLPGLPLVLLAAAFLSNPFQGTVPTLHKQPTKSSKTPVVLAGCLSLPQFKVTTSDLGVPRTVRLHGGKAMMALLKEHNGHGDDLTGILNEGDRAMGGTKDKKAGKTRVFVGARSETTDSSIVYEPVFEVQSIQHVGRPCTSGG